MMRPRPLTFLVIVLGIAGVLLSSGAPAVGQNPRSGGVLTVAQREETPQGFAIHESSTVLTTWSAMPCFGHLVLFHPLKPQESVDTVVGEWPRSGRGRTTTATWSSSCART